MDPLPPMQPMKPMEPLRFERWWPADLGEPSTAGGQNGLRFAVFPDKRRLLIDRDGQRTTYDLGDHRIEGVQSQGQGGGASTIALSSQNGPLRLDELSIVDGADAHRDDQPSNARPSGARAEPARREDPKFDRATASTGSSENTHSAPNDKPERIVFSEEGHGCSIKLMVQGALDAELIDAAEEFLKRQRRRLSRT